MKNVLVISGHTDLQHDSFNNKIIMADLEKALPEARFEYLDAMYPNFKIDVKKEQEQLVWADVIVLQFPVFWYSMPSLLARWMEQTFEHGFSHGAKGKALVGKKLLLSFTVGAPEDMYREGGFQLYPVEMMTTRFIQTAHLCSLDYEGAVYTCGLGYVNSDDAEACKAMESAAHEHAQRVINRIEELAK